MPIFMLSKYLKQRKSNTGRRSYAYALGSEGAGLQTGAWPLGGTEGRGRQNGWSGWCEDRKRKKRRKQVGGDSWPRMRGLRKRVDWRALRFSAEEAAGSG